MIQSRGCVGHVDWNQDVAVDTLMFEVTDAGHSIKVLQLNAKSGSASGIIIRVSGVIPLAAAESTAVLDIRLTDYHLRKIERAFRPPRKV